ncbi:MAG: hypothetical protein H6679_05090 [Epsilonproteobacteria bacterium]|nr:hypothetical protein [Campylobacterota bacterium]
MKMLALFIIFLLTTCVTESSLPNQTRHTYTKQNGLEILLALSKAAITGYSFNPNTQNSSATTHTTLAVLKDLASLGNATASHCNKSQSASLHYRYVWMLYDIHHLLYHLWLYISGDNDSRSELMRNFFNKSDCNRVNNIIQLLHYSLATLQSICGTNIALTIPQDNYLEECYLLQAIEAFTRSLTECFIHKNTQYLTKPHLVFILANLAYTTYYIHSYINSPQKTAEKKKKIKELGSLINLFADDVF